MTPDSPWRQPIVWLVILLVAAAVVGGVVMVRVAGSGGPMDAVPDAVQRTGQAQQADLGPDARAARRQLSAIVRIDAWGKWREVSMDGVAEPREEGETRDTPMHTFQAVRDGRLANPSTVANGLRFARLWDAIKLSASRDGEAVTLEVTAPR